MIYLDNASTTKPYETVIEEIAPYFYGEFGNPGSLHALGRSAKAAIEEARARVAKLIGADPRQIFFTSGGTEANNMVFSLLWGFMEDNKKTHVVTDLTEHDSVLRSVEKMCIKHGFHSTLIPPESDGTISEEKVRQAITDDTALVSVMYINNETGAINNINSIARICERNGVLFHTDCVQAAGNIPIDVKEIGCDFMSLSAHKMHGIKGCGALYIKEPEKFTSYPGLVVGGASQEHGFRAGTENVPAIVAFGNACNNLIGVDVPFDVIGINKLHTYFVKSLFLEELIKKLGGISDILTVNALNQDGAPNDSRILSLTFKGIDAETLLLLLDAHGVYASSGAACSSNNMRPSRVLKAMGISDEDAMSTIRFSFSEDNTKEDAVSAAQIVSDCVKRLKETSK